MTRIKAALAAGIRPTAMLFHEQPTGPWSEMDFRWLEAYQITQDEICPQCGNPIWLCRSTDDRISWTKHESVCRATKEKENLEWKQTHKKAATAEDRKAMGRIVFMTPTVSSWYPEGTLLPTREDYYRGDQH